MFKKFLSIFLINLLVFYQIAFFIPPVFAQDATESAIAGSTTEESLPEPSTSPTPSPTEESTPPSASVEPSPNPEPSPEATATPNPSPTPILDITNETETSASASLSEKSTIRPVPSEKKIKKGSNKNYVEGQVLVKFKESKINLKQASSISKAKEFADVKNLKLEETIEKSNVAVLETKGESVENAIDRLEDDSNVQYAEPNYIRTPATISTDDTFRDRLWGLDNTGQSVDGVPGTNDADMDSPESWGLSEGNSNIIVAIIDSGVDYNHPDLQTNMWDGTSCKDENGVALNNCNHGYDFADNDKTPLPSNNSHGTHLAGTIAAVKNNNKGIIGVAPSVKIMALKYGFDVASGVRAVDFAIQNGAKIINASYAGSYSQTEYDAINRFKAAGGIFITVAGNETVNNDAGAHSYPSDYDLDNIISVTATDQNDNLADFSNYGATSVDVAAPGVNIYSTIADLISTEVLNEPFTSVVPPALPSGWVKTGNWGTYDFGDQIWGKVLYGDLALPYASNANSTVTSATYNLSGASGVDMGFFAVCDTEYITDGWHDYMALEVSSNGIDFTEIMKWDEAFLDDDLTESNNTNGKAVFYLTPTIPTSYFTSNFKFRLHWVTDADTSTGTIGEGCNVDDILITKHTLGSSELYEFKDGTSMAAPHVAGLAALILSHNSSRTYSQVKSIILNTGDAKASLSGKTVSGKRVNANNALLATNGPVISGLSNDTSSTKSKTWNWSSTDSTATFRFAIDQSSSWTPTGDYSSTATATQGSGNGTYYIHVQAKNSSDIESEVITVSAVLDNTAPTTPGTPIPSPSSPTNQTTQTWNWTASTDNIAGTITYIWSIINNVTSALFDTGTTTNTFLVTNLLQGVWNLIVNANDNAGNQSATATGTIAVDTTASTGSITAPANNSSHNAIPAFTASASDANTAVSSVKFQYKASPDSTFIDLNTDTVAPYQADWTSVTLTTNTTYNLQVVITDSAGNTSNISGVSFAYDTTAPNAPSTPDLAASDDTGISNSDNITNQTTGLTFSGTAEANSTVELFDGVTSKGTTTATGGNWSFDITLATGTHSLTAKATDAVGNTSVASGVLEITIETAAPDAPTSVNLTSPINNSNKTTVTLTGTGEADASVNYTISDADNVHTVSGTGTVAGNGSISITNIDVSILSDGAITASATLTDAVGNTSSVGTDATPSIKDVVAPSAPTVTLLDPINNENKTAVTITGTGEANDNFTYSITDGVNAAITGDGSVAGNGSITISGINVSGLNEGILTASVTLTDAAGNSGNTGSDTATKDVAVPTLSNVSISSNNSNSNALAKVGNMVTVSFASNETIQTPAVTISGNSATVSNTGGNNWKADYQMASGDTSGTVVFAINFTDLAGNTGSEVNTTEDNTSITFDKTKPGAPVISNVSTDNKINNSEKAAIIIVGTAEANSSITVTLTDSADTAKTNTGSANGSGNFSITIDGTAGTDLIDGTINVSATAADAAGNISNATTSNVTQDTVAPSAPTVNNISTDNKINNSEKAAIIIAGTAEANSLVSITLSDGTNNKNGTQQLTGGDTSFSITINGTTATPGALVDGSITPSVTATDAAGNVSSTTSSPTATQDTVAPTGTFTINSAATYTNSTGVTLNFSGVSSDVTQIQIANGDSVFGANVAYSSSYSYTLPNTQGTRTVQVKLIDGAGNISGIISDAIILDSVDPVIETYTLDNIRISPEASVGIKDTATLDLLFSEAVEVDINILNSSSTKIRDLYSSASVTNPTPRTWDGKNNSDAFVSEGIYTIKIIITDQAGNSITDTSKTITINNDPLSLNPIGNKSINEGSELTFTAHADDEEGGTLTFSLTGAPTGATINSSTGAFSWTPTEAQGQGSYTFTISVASSTGTNASEEITIIVNEVNIAPVASGSSQTTNEDTAKTITLSATDADLSANTLTYSIATGPSHGTLGAISGTQVTYTPTSNYNGSDSFTFKANDGTADSNIATVNLTITTVDDAPTSSNGTVTVNEDTAQSISMTAQDVDEDSLTYIIISNPTNGSLSALNATAGTVTYTPNLNFNGSDSFTFKVNDGATDSNISTITINITAINDAPSFDAISNQTVSEDASAQNISIANVSSGPSNESGQTVTLSATSSNQSIIPNPIVSGSSSTRTLTYAPVANANGTVTITVTANDGQAQSNTSTRTFTITVSPVNDAPSFDAIVDKNINEDASTQNISITNILSGPAGATDESGQTVTLTATSNDTSIVPNPSVSVVSAGTATLSYTPVANANGTVTITVTANDGQAQSNIFTRDFTITVNAVNDNPDAINDSITVDEDSAATTANVLTNDTFAPDTGETLTIADVTQGSHGTVAITNSGMNLAYTPTANYNGSDSFTYTISDGNGGIDTATVSVTVTAINDNPVVTVIAPNGEEIWAGGSSHAITWNASDADNDSEDLVIDLYYTTNGTEFTEIDTGLNNTGDYTWDPVDSLDSSTVKIKAVVTDPDDATGTDLSNANFTIDSTAPTVPGTPSTSPNPTNSTTQTWNWTAATDTLSGVASYFWSVVNNANSQIVDSGTTAGNILSASTSLLQGVWNFIVGAQDNAGNQSSTSTDQLVVDTTVPTVTKLGNGSVDVVLLSPGNINLVFSEVLSNNSKTVVENALTAGADKALTYSWSGKTLIITTTEVPTFANDVTANVSDLAGNSAIGLLLVDSLADTQTTPDGSGNASLSDEIPEVVITNPTQPVDITIGSGTDNPTIDVSAFITGGAGDVPQITIDSENADVAIPATTVTGPAGWDGIIAAPTITTVTLPETSGETKIVSTAIEIGLTGAKLSFDKAVRILLPGQAGKRAGYIRTGIAFTEISSACFADNQTAGDALVTDGECKIDAGSDLVIWTKHFTKFVTYTQTTIASSTSNSSSSDGGGSSASSCNDQKPGNAPVLLSAVTSGVNGVTLTWSEAKDPVTYYLVAYGTASGIVQYGNPNIGGKGTTSYTVQGLSGGTTYYFKVRAGNGCTPGDFSNEVSATPAGVFITAPATGFEEGVLGESTDQPDQQQDKEEKGQEGTVKGVETIPTESSQEVGSFAQRNWPWMAVVILIISGTGYYLFIRRR